MRDILHFKGNVNSFQGVKFMNNYVMNALGYQKKARIIYSESTGLIRQVQKNLHCGNGLKRTFLEFVTAMGVMSGLLVDRESLFIKLTGDHPDRQMTGTVDASGNISGFVKEGFLPTREKAPFGKHGCISVNRDTGYFNGYTGIVEMPYQTVARNLENYFRRSEQLPTCVRLFLKTDSNGNIMLARGLMLQLLPGEPTTILSDFAGTIFKNASLFLVPSLGICPDTWNQLLGGDFHYMSQKAIQYQCSCTKEQYYGILFSLSPAEVNEIMVKKQTLEAACSLCLKKYYFPHNEIAGLFGIPASLPDTK